MFGEFRERDPTSRVHVKMVFILDIFLIHLIHSDSLCSEPKHRPLSAFFRPRNNKRVANAPPTQKADELTLELSRKITDVLPGMFSDDEHLPKMGL